jgi:hypothetical protein
MDFGFEVLFAMSTVTFAAATTTAATAVSTAAATATSIVTVTVTVTITIAIVSSAATATATTSVLGFRKLFHVDEFANIGGQEDSTMQDLPYPIGRDHDVLLQKAAFFQHQVANGCRLWVNHDEAQSTDLFAVDSVYVGTHMEFG